MLTLFQRGLQNLADVTQVLQTLLDIRQPVFDQVLDISALRWRSGLVGEQERVVFLKVDTDEHAELAKHFDVEGLPDIRFLNPDGTEVHRLNDFQDAELFSDSLRRLLDGSLGAPQSGATSDGL